MADRHHQTAHRVPTISGAPRKRLHLLGGIEAALVRRRKRMTPRAFDAGHPPMTSAPAVTFDSCTWMQREITPRVDVAFFVRGVTLQDEAKTLVLPVFPRDRLPASDLLGLDSCSLFALDHRVDAISAKGWLATSS